MKKKGNIILFIIMIVFSIGIIFFAVTYKKEIIQIENKNFSKNERLCEILDVNKVTVKYFVGDIDYTEKETYIEIIKKNGDCIETVIILPAGTIRFFNINTGEDYAENNRE